MDTLSFGSPMWGLGFLVLLGLVWIWVVHIRKRKARREAFCEAKFFKSLFPDFSMQQGVRKGVFFFLGMSFLILSLMQPQWGEQRKEVHQSGLDLLIVLDISQSMETQDVAPSRLEAVKALLRTLLSKLSGDRVGVVAFAGSAFLAAPLTTDLLYVQEVLENLSPQSVSYQGTDLGLALEMSAEAFRRGAEALTQNMLSARYVLLLTDGEDWQKGIEHGLQALKKLQVTLWTVGIGTEKGGPIPVRDRSGNLISYKKDRTGAVVLSRFRGSVLKKLTHSVGGVHWTLGKGTNVLNALSRYVLTAKRTASLKHEIVISKQWYGVTLFIALLFFLLEWGQGFFKKATALVFGIFFVTSFIQERTVFALSIFDYEAHKKAMKAYKKKDLKTAQKIINHLQSKDPENAVLNNNQSVLLYQQGDVHLSQARAKQAVQKAIEDQNNALAADSLYNLGSAQERGHKWKEAVQSYLKSIEFAKRAKRKKTQQFARMRLEQLIQKRMSQKPGKGKNKQGGKQGDKSNQKPQDVKKWQQKGTPPPKLTRQQAKQVMNQLLREENKVRKRLREKTRPPRRRSEKDW